MNSSSIEQLRQVVKQNPELFELLTGSKRTGRPAGSKNKQSITPGQTIEVPQQPDEEPQPISLSRAKELLKKQRKPRVLSEESRAKMLENLQKGREALKAKKQSAPREPRPSTPEQHPDKNVVVKKYVVKQPPVKKQKQSVKHQPEFIYDDESSEEEELKSVKLRKTERMLEKLEQLQQRIQNTPQPRQARETLQQPALRRQGAFRMFY
jgi:hypothetical protein